MGMEVLNRDAIGDKCQELTALIRRHTDGNGKYLQLEKEKIEDNSAVALPDQQDSSPENSQKQDEEDLEPVSVNITHGYSRDHRPDLKQYTLTLLTTEAEGIPLFMQVGSGNELDQKAFY